MKTITVAELIAVLQNEDPALPVVFSSDYGDHAHTQQAHAIGGQCETVHLSATAYANSGFAVADNNDDDQSDAEFLLLS